MAFFLIVPSVIVVTIFLVHSAAGRLGFKAKYSSLILCAIMALVVNFLAIELSTYLDKWYFVKLGALIAAASIIVTLINLYLIRHEKTDMVIIDDDVGEELTVEEAEVKDDLVFNESVEMAKPIETITVTPKEDKPESAEKSKADTTVKSKVEVKIKPTTPPTTDTKKSEAATPLDTFKKVEKESTKPVGDVEEKAAIVTESAPIEKADIKPTIPQKVDDIQNTENIHQKESIKKISDELPEKNPDKSTEKSVNKPSEKLKDDPLDINAHIDSLDDILDYAYSQKAKGDLNQAILAYQKALDRYKNDDYAPFIAIDLGNIYKEQAAYTKVIKTYEEALKLPVVMRNADTRKEFEKNLNYMRIVQAVLVRHRALTMPFSKIPKQYLQEVETEYKSLQLNHSTIQKRY